ncbi:MAG TPA: alpha/beta hydrolase [Novosphingobium sp.]|nr:alpha/beta hydrolase [Novosphingobium sp.]
MFLTSRRPLLSSLLLAGNASKVAATSPGGPACYGLDQNAEASAFRAPLPPAPPAKESLARAGSARLWYQDTGGDGTPVVFVHAATGSGQCWGYQMAAFTKAGHRAIAYSRRGYRGSDRGTSDDANNDVDDLLALVDFLRLDRFHLVATAGGAVVAAAFATRPIGKRLVSLTLACSTLLLPKEQWGDFAPLDDFPQWSGLPHDFMELGPAYRTANPAGTAVWNDLIARSFGDNPRPDAATMMRAFGAVKSAADLRRITAPTLFIAGDADLFAPAPLMKYISTLVPRSRLAIISGAGHSAYWERPDVFNRIVTDFMT